MMGYTVAINSVFAIMIAATYLFGNAKSGTADSTFLLNLLFYIIITLIITVTLTKMMYAGENTMVVEDALSRIDSILEMQPLKETEKKKYRQILRLHLKMYHSVIREHQRMRSCHMKCRMVQQ